MTNFQNHLLFKINCYFWIKEYLYISYCIHNEKYLIIFKKIVIVLYFKDNFMSMSYLVMIIIIILNFNSYYFRLNLNNTFYYFLYIYN